MSLHTALQAIGIVIVGTLLFGTLLDMGPLAWVIFGTMLVLGVLQVQRRRRNRAAEDDDAYCANCGTELDFELFDAEGGDQWGVAYCPSCGAPVNSDRDADAFGGTMNCPDCGSPNDAGNERCQYCETPL